MACLRRWFRSTFADRIDECVESDKRKPVVVGVGSCSIVCVSSSRNRAIKFVASLEDAEDIRRANIIMSDSLQCFGSFIPQWKDANRTMRKYSSNMFIEYIMFIRTVLQDIAKRLHCTPVCEINGINDYPDKVWSLANTVMHRCVPLPFVPTKENFYKLSSWCDKISNNEYTIPVFMSDFISPHIRGYMSFLEDDELFLDVLKDYLVFVITSVLHSLYKHGVMLGDLKDDNVLPYSTRRHKKLLSRVYEDVCVSYEASSLFWFMVVDYSVMERVGRKEYDMTWFDEIHYVLRSVDSNLLVYCQREHETAVRNRCEQLRLFVRNVLRHCPACCKYNDRSYHHVYMSLSPMVLLEEMVSAEFFGGSLSLLKEERNGEWTRADDWIPQDWHLLFEENSHSSKDDSSKDDSSKDDSSKDESGAYAMFSESTETEPDCSSTEKHDCEERGDGYPEDK